MKKQVLMMFGIAAIAIMSGCAEYSKINVDGDVFYLPKCKPIVTYSGHSFGIKGIEVPISNQTIKIGEVNWKPETIQQASAIVQVLDNHRMSTCQMLPAYASAGGRDKFASYLAQMQSDEARISQLALLLAANDPAAVDKYIATYAGAAVALATPKTAGFASGEKGLLPMTSKAAASLTAQIPKALKGVTAGDPNTLVPADAFLK